MFSASPITSEAGEGGGGASNDIKPKLLLIYVC